MASPPRTSTPAMTVTRSTTACLAADRATSEDLAVRRLWPLAFALACSFDGSGFGDQPAASAGDTSTSAAASSGAAPITTGSTSAASTSTTAAASTTDAPADPTAPLTSTDPSTTSGGSTTDDTSTSTSTSTGLDDTTGTASTTGPVPCVDVPYKQVVKVGQATTVAPMIKAMSNQGEGMIAFSEVAGQGTVSFPLDVPCDGQFAVWGRVFDGEGGVNNNDPDSYFVRADADPEIEWFYGCQSPASGYGWYRVRSGMQGIDCDANVPWLVPLPTGAHTITLRNREPKDGSGNVAAIARILITSDLDYVPTADE